MCPSQWSLSPHCLHLQERKGARRGALLQGCPTLSAGKRQPLAMCSTTGRAGDPATSAKQHGKRSVASLIEGGSALFTLGPGLAQDPVPLRPPSPSCSGDGERPHCGHQPAIALFQVVTLCSRLSPSAQLLLILAASQSFWAARRQSLPARVDSTCAQAHNLFVHWGGGGILGGFYFFLNHQSDISLESKRTNLGVGLGSGSSRLSPRCAYRGFPLTFRTDFCFLLTRSSPSPFCHFHGDISAVQSWASLLLRQELHSCFTVLWC